jgi:hypothetical protein
MGESGWFATLGGFARPRPAISTVNGVILGTITGNFVILTGRKAPGETLQEELPEAEQFRRFAEVQPRSPPTCYTVLRVLHASTACRRTFRLLGLGWHFNETLLHSASTI